MANSNRSKCLKFLSTKAFLVKTLVLIKILELPVCVIVVFQSTRGCLCISLVHSMHLKDFSLNLKSNVL